jgi:hypothetical protein
VARRELHTSAVQGCTENSLQAALFFGSAGGEINPRDLKSVASAVADAAFRALRVKQHSSALPRVE